MSDDRFKRSLGDPVPNRLEIVNGVVLMKDGTNVNTYLKQWQDSCKFKNGTEICILTKESLRELEDRLIFATSLLIG